jgi:hypothetical protein
MKKSVIIVFAVTASFVGELSALDLTPHEIHPTGDVPLVKRYYFEDSIKRLSFRLDNKMTVRGAPDSVAFHFNDIKTAGMTISKSRMSSEMPFDQKNLESYRAAARALLPSDAKNIQLEEEKPDAISINGWTSQQFIFTYDSLGSPCRRSVTFLNYSEKEQIILDVGASAPDYEKTYIRGYRVLNSFSDFRSDSSSGPT